MNRIKKNVFHLATILVGYTPVALFNFKKHYELYKVLKFYRDNNLIKFRTYGIYLFTYVSKKLSIREKLFILTHHYSFLKLSFKKNSLKRIFSEGLLCWEEYDEEDKFRILLKASHYLEYEGSLTLLFTVNDVPVFNLNFNFAPGHIFGFKEEKNLIIVSGLKGVENEFSNITLISKSFLEMSPRVILMKVLESLASSLGVTTIIGINVSNQVSFSNQAPHERFYKSYDQFWEQIKGKKLSTGYYCLKCPGPEKSIDSIRHQYKKRAINRRIKLKDIFSKSESNISANKC